MLSAPEAGRNQSEPFCILLQGKRNQWLEITGPNERGKYMGNHKLSKEAEEHIKKKILDIPYAQSVSFPDIGYLVSESGE